MSFYAGLDLGQSADFTALAVVQDVKEMNETTTPGKPERRLLLRHLERYPLRAPYPEIASQAGALMRDPHLSPDVFDGVRPARKHPRLAVDAPGVGWDATDLLTTKGLRFTRA